MYSKILDGEIEVRGRLPGQMNYNVIEKTDWRSSTFMWVSNPISLWKMEIVPRGVVRIEADGEIEASDKPSEKRNAVIRNYDSLLVDAHQVEAAWPAKIAFEDKARKLLLKRAKKERLDAPTIKWLS